MLDDNNNGGGDSEHLVSLELGVKTDQGRFLRRTCPSCGKDYKTEVDPADLQWAVAPYIRQLGVDFGEQPASTVHQPDLFYCPYCGHSSPAQDTLTEETSIYLGRLINREIIIPAFQKMLSGVDGAGSGGGFISVSFSYERGMLPTRPIHGPEPPDMKVITFLCCKRSIKVSERWSRVETCTYCNGPVVLEPLELKP